MKHVVRYLLEGNGTIPTFIEDGGYYPQGEELVGISIDEEKRHLPGTVKKLTEEELYDRIVLLECKDHITQELLTPEQIQSLVNEMFSKL